jgi:hypothetical protein
MTFWPTVVDPIYWPSYPDPETAIHPVGEMNETVVYGTTVVLEDGGFREREPC